jgi:hypothetical protein
MIMFSRVQGAFLLAVILQLWLAGPAYAEGGSWPPLAISSGTHSLTVPWHTGPVAKRLNPALFAGTERVLRRGRHLTLIQTANLGFFQNYWWMNGITADTELGIRRWLPLGLDVDLRVGAGYMHYFWRRQTLVLEGGRYVKARDWGRPSLVIPMSLVLGYSGNGANRLSMSPFICARWAVQALFKEEIPVMTHFILSAGLRMDWGGRSTPSGDN